MRKKAVGIDLETNSVMAVVREECARYYSDGDE